MAKLICDDGTEVKISKETEKNLRKLGKKKFEPIKIGRLTIKIVESSAYPIKIFGDEGFIEGFDVNGEEYHIHRLIKALQSAKDFLTK